MFFSYWITGNRQSLGNGAIAMGIEYAAAFEIELQPVIFAFNPSVS
jgi:hypothetical protein